MKDFRKTFIAIWVKFYEFDLWFCLNLKIFFCFINLNLEDALKIKKLKFIKIHSNFFIKFHFKERDIPTYQMKWETFFGQNTINFMDSIKSPIKYIEFIKL